MRQRMSVTLAAGAVAAGLVMAAPAPAVAQEPFIGEIRMVGFNFCPRGWAPAAGQLLPINQNQALFALLGTTYGGDGRTTFALPDLRGRVPIADGAGPGLSNVRLGEQGGREQAQLTANELPSHGHDASTAVTIHASNATANSVRPGNRVLARSRIVLRPEDDRPAPRGQVHVYRSGAADVPMADAAATAETTVGDAGGSLPFSVRDPFLGIRFCIALFGIFPSRS
jgi:microcystin-dependent protein